MAAIGSLVFCTTCGDLLDGSSGDSKIVLTCRVCGTENQGILGTWYHIGAENLR